MTRHALSLTLCLLTLCLAHAEAATHAPRRRLTFDLGWQFRLCADSADVAATLGALGIADVRLEAQPAAATARTQVTDDTEPEQATVTAGPVTTALAPQTAPAQPTAGSDGPDAPAGLAGFRPVQLPHDWSIELPFDPQMGGSAGYLAGGQGIYVKDFALPEALRRAGRVALHFDGAYHRATVWVNGRRMGCHVYGYTPFEYDITPLLQADNRIVVHLSRDEQSRWYTGSGLYRHVWLDVSQAVHVADCGVAVTASAAGNVEVSVDVEGPAPGSIEGVTVACHVVDASGRKVATAQARRTADGSPTHAAFATQGLTVPSPEPWSPGRPCLYTLRTTVRDRRGRLVDQVDTPFGLRDLRFDADSGFYLNGEPTRLRGLCLHQDAGSLGVAVPDRVWERRLAALRDIGCNAIRCSHNPPSPELLDLCDRLGLMVIDEAFDKWKSGYYAPYYDACAHQDLTDMVRRDRNHPSVIVWSIGNEVSEAWLATDEGVDRARDLNGLVHRLDPSRPTLVACQQGFQDKFGEVTDLVGYNYLEPRMLIDHQRHPRRKMLVTEAFVYYSGLRPDVVRDFVEVNPWHFVAENAFIAGSFVWAGVDYLGESSPWPAKGWCSCPFDMTLRERPQAAFYHTAWRPDEPYLKLMVRDNCLDQAVGTDHWQYPPMADTWDLPYTDSRCVEVRCYTTCDSVQFFFPMWSNPQLPLKPRVTADYPDHCITIQLPARAGKMLAVGYRDGRPAMRDSLINHGPVADVRLEPDLTRLTALPADMTDASAPGAPRRDVAHVALSLVDSLGRLQQMEPRRFRVETEGPIRLLGVETGDMRRHGSWRTTELPTYFGAGLIRLQSTTQRGTARLIVHVEGFDQPFVTEFTIE